MGDTIASLLIEARKIIKASCIHKHPDFIRRSAEALKKKGSDGEYVLIKKQLLDDLVHLFDLRTHNGHGSPNHAHEVKGIWDSDNGVLANKPCAECEIYEAARKLISQNHIEGMSNG